MEKRGLKFSFRMAVGIIVIVAFVLTSAISAEPDSSFGIEMHYVCFAQTRIATQVFLTPILIVNSPYGGSANGTAY